MKKIWLGPLAIFISGVIFFFDQITKRWMFTSDHAPTFFILHGLIQTTQHRNAGIIANLALPTWLILSMSLVVMLMLIIGIILCVKQSNRSSLISASLILGGALGNTFDRMTFGYVRDWLLLFNRSAINLADASIVIGILGYGLQTYLRRKSELRRN